MTYKEMCKKVLGMIEELNQESELLTDDPDIQNKILDVTEQVMFELARMKKIPAYTELAVEEGRIITFEDIEQQEGHSVYQLDKVSGVNVDLKAQGTVIKALESGTMEIEFFRYPERILEENQDEYVFELSEDALEIMPYGIAGDLLKSDVSANYGQIYARRYEDMLQKLDSRYSVGMIAYEGGVDI